MLSSIEELNNLDEIRNELRVFPESLDEAYGSPMAMNVRISDGDTDTGEYLRKSRISLMLLKGSVDLFWVGLAAHLRL